MNETTANDVDHHRQRKSLPSPKASASVKPQIEAKATPEKKEDLGEKSPAKKQDSKPAVAKDTTPFHILSSFWH